MQPGTVLIMKGQEDVGRDQPLSRVIHPPHPPPPSSKSRYEGNARRTSPSTGNKGSAGQEGEFPCKKCGRSVIRNITIGRCCCVGDVGMALFAYNSRHLSYISGLTLNQLDIKRRISAGNVATAIAHLEYE